LGFKALINIAFLSDFDILRECRTDIRSAQWSKPLIRKAITSWQGTLRAREEIVRVGVEACRLQTWIFDEEKHL
ncbi:hypothetical protein BOTBODRAFT_76489, partial [Botryobasidium botryosum FD-172 SS1]